MNNIKKQLLYLREVAFLCVIIDKNGKNPQEYKKILENPQK